MCEYSIIFFFEYCLILFDLKLISKKLTFIQPKKKKNLHSYSSKRKRYVMNCNVFSNAYQLRFLFLLKRCHLTTEEIYHICACMQTQRFLSKKSLSPTNNIHIHQRVTQSTTSLISIHARLTIFPFQADFYFCSNHPFQ